MRATHFFGLTAALLLCGLMDVDRSAMGEQINLQVSATHPTMLAGEKQLNHVRISLTGFELPENKDRPPINVAIVIDTSGSMGGKKITQARDAAIAAVNRLQGSDIVSIVLYNSSAQVLVPATKATDRAEIIRKIKSIRADGSTALFAGVSKGAAEVRKFKEDGSVNRVILLSDGLANVGPKSPGELERLGASLVKEGISVSTMGLGSGYNEDLMSRLANASSGNHVFVEQAEDLIAIFNNEFNTLMSAVAGDFEIHARVADGVRPVRVLGNKADIEGKDVHIPLAQLYSGQERYFMLEVEVEAGETDEKRSLVDVSVAYQNLVTETTDKLSSSLGVRFTDRTDLVKNDMDYETYGLFSIQLANDNNIRATALRDAGKVEEARKLLLTNAKQLTDAAGKCLSNGVTSVNDELTRNVRLNQSQATLIDKPEYKTSGRKRMLQEQVINSAQQSYRGAPAKKQ